MVKGGAHMKFKNIGYSVERMVKDHDNVSVNGRSSKLNFDFAIQRPEGQWNRAAQSLLIHSILQGLLVPEIFIVKNAIDRFQPMTVLDGKQRLTTLYQYVAGDFPLSKNTPPVEYERAVLDDNGECVFDENGVHKTVIEFIEIGGKRFKQLPADFQDDILSFEFSVRLITEATTKELEDQMFRLNNGKSQTATQKAIIALGMDLAGVVTKVSHNSFVYDRLTFTNAQRKNSEDLKIILNTFAVLNGYQYKRLSGATDMVNIANTIRDGGWTDGQMDYCEELFERLNDLLPLTDDGREEIAEDVFRTPQIPVLISNVDKYLQLLDDDLITEQQYKGFLEYWTSKGFFADEYQQYCGKNVNDKSQVDARIEYMEKELLKFVGIEGEKISNDKSDEKNIDTLDISNDELKTFIEVVQTEHTCDEETVLRVLENASEYQVDAADNLQDFVDYMENLSSDKLTELTTKTMDMVLSIPAGSVTDVELPTLVSLLKYSENEGYTMSEFKQWFDTWRNSADDTYDDLMGRADYSNASQTERFSYLANAYINYINRA